MGLDYRRVKMAYLRREYVEIGRENSTITVSNVEIFNTRVSVLIVIKNR